ncbi:hypothetical protein; putative signal peptide [Bradyrhizobium sp. ORS 278]|uniref:hypothetical protein n=1 Tax=Bradyrhizobium sp. (strain ORS 278) TaxID=114615 RepID=UPI0001508806|nr:hypothetical protein [Bradyrhizobium sp. ORS 278]CAL80093.1 hypothetical protein; putative signal peptide [Bradyrhizobium sp. ORS 278]
MMSFAPQPKEILRELRALACLLTCALALAWPARSPAADASASATVEILNGPTPGELAVRAHGRVELAPELIVEEQRDDGSFERVTDLDGGTMRLVASCDQRPGACVTIDERGLRPEPWSGMTCSSQCNGNCDRNYPLWGRFRFVVMSCDRRTRFEGRVFELPRPTHGSRFRRP